MEDFDLKKYLAENKLIKEELTYEFSEYDFDITEEPGFQEEVIKHIKSAHPDIEDEIMMKMIRSAEDYYYREARNENKRGREYEPVSSSEFADGVIMDYEDQLPYLEENKLLKEGLKLEQNPFDQQGLFLSSDGGRSGVFITTDLDFDITDYEMDGDEERGNLNGMDVRIISVYG